MKNLHPLTIRRFGRIGFVICLVFLWLWSWVRRGRVCSRWCVFWRDWLHLRQRWLTGASCAADSPASESRTLHGLEAFGTGDTGCRLHGEGSACTFYTCSKCLRAFVAFAEGRRFAGSAASLWHRFLCFSLWFFQSFFWLLPNLLLTILYYSTSVIGKSASWLTAVVPFTRSFVWFKDHERQWQPSRRPAPGASLRGRAILSRAPRRALAPWLLACLRSPTPLSLIASALCWSPSGLPPSTPILLCNP